MKAPHGYAKIKAFYGWDPEYLDQRTGKVSAAWERNVIRRAKLPAPLPLSWDPKVSVSSVAVHKLVVPVFEEFYARAHAEGMWPYLAPYGGGYTFRIKRTSGQLSMHSFGGAVDHDPAGNPQREGIVTDWQEGPQRWRMANEVVEIARECGLTWGGDFDDPMHFSSAPATER